MKVNKSNLKIIKLLDDPISIEEQEKSLRKLAKDAPGKDEDKIVSYLENGLMLFVTPLAIFDWLGDKDKFIGGASIRTDGTWFWRDYLAYFVKTYHFDLPDDFINHARNNNWKVPEILYEQEKLPVVEYYELRKLEKFGS
jgi:hypothetical protein